MNDLPNLKRETRYGMPAADHILYNRHYVLGYSYYFRQAKWALEIVDSGKKDIERIDNFRSDYRIPEKFRADLVDYEGSGYDRGHLVASANKNEINLQNSETFLLSNMSPQHPRFNRDIWRKLESAVRKLDDNIDIWETYVICGPIFYFDKPVESIGTQDDNDVSIPIPNAYFKSILTEDKRGALKMWSFLMANEKSDKPLGDFLVPTALIEKLSGLLLWEGLVGAKIIKEKNQVRKMWKY
ncbi:DNA/RNA non-specific endonuclease [Bacteroidota bacterium]